MGSSVNGLGSFDPLTFLNSLTAPASSANSAASTNGVSAQQEFSAMQKHGDLNSLLSDSLAVGVLQMAEPSSAQSATGTDLSNLVNQLIAAYTPRGSASSAATLSTNPALAIIQSLEATGALGSDITDSIGASVLGQTSG